MCGHQRSSQHTSYKKCKVNVCEDHILMTKLIFFFFFVNFKKNQFLKLLRNIHTYTKHTHKYSMNMKRLSLFASICNSDEEVKHKQYTPQTKMD